MADYLSLSGIYPNAALPRIFALFFFRYMFPIYKRAYKKKLTEDDLFSPLPSHNFCFLGAELEKIWIKEQGKHKKAALHRALLKITVVPFSIGKLVRYFETNQKTISENEAYYYCGALVLGITIDAVLAHPRLMSHQHLAMKMRVACGSLIYRKTMKLSRNALKKATVGQMVNLLSNDLSRLDQGFILAHFAWIGPVQVTIGTWLLYREIGYAALFGVAFLISFVPLEGNFRRSCSFEPFTLQLILINHAFLLAFLAKRTSVLRLRTALRTDERVRLMNEVISGIQEGMEAIRGHAIIMGLIYSFEVFVARTAIFLSILGYVLLGNYVTAEKVFSITAIYNVLRPVITILFSISISSIAEVNVSICRVQKFLSYEEVSGEKEPKGTENGLDKHESINSKPRKEYFTKPKLVLRNVCAKWEEGNVENTLENIYLNVSSNKLLAVTGPVGAGKSSLINVILKELPIHSGTMEIQGTLSYASQEPWLFSGSVMHNIHFGEEYDETRYNKVVEVCALKSDFALFPYGDKTLVGEKGKLLSGGQKARINLARCIYKKADIYLLDDPLSAVDANVGKHLYESCIQDFLKDKMRILVTHQLQYLQSADIIVIMNDGQIQVEGNYKELQSSGVNFSKLFDAQSTEEEGEKRKTTSRQNSEVKYNLSGEDDDIEEPLLEKETQDSGTISASVYLQYFKSGGNICTILLLVNLEQDLADKVAANLTLSNETTIDRTQILYIYSGLTGLTIVISVVKAIFFMFFFTVASKKLHDFIFSKIVQAKMRFYNSNPSGRILNRFSKDIGYIDEYIPSVLLDVIEIALLLSGTIVLTSIVEPFLLIAALG
ncbi:hypothetical protein YQE_02982, partial [Dendroctonus ponderosae]